MAFLAPRRAAALTGQTLCADGGLILRSHATTPSCVDPRRLTVTIAATTIGLKQRPDPAAVDADWTPVAGTPFNTLTDEITDALWTAAVGAAPARLWVWVRNGDKAGLWVRATAQPLSEGAEPIFPRPCG